MEDSDATLVERARSGDGSAFAALVHRHSPRAYRVARRLCRSGADAEEVVQEAFLQVHRHLDGFRGEAVFATWLYRVVTNAALMHQRGGRKTESLEQYLPSFDANGVQARLDVTAELPALPDEVAARAELRDRVLEVLAALPDGQRAAFVLRDIEELTTEEVAEVLDIDPAAVRQRVHRARLVLRGVIRRALGGEP